MKLKKLLSINKLKKSETISKMGYLESILPNKISGWFFSREGTYEKIGLFYDGKLLKETNIDIDRIDVSNKYNVEKKCGFSIHLDHNYLENTKIENENLLYVSPIDNLGVSNYELKYLNDAENTNLILRLALDEPIIGSEGYLEGLKDDGLIHGWISMNVNELSQKFIWAHGLKEEPVMVMCNLSRRIEYLKKGFISKGFCIDPSSFIKNFQEKNIWCSFDYEGYIKLPNITEVTINRKTLNFLKSVKNPYSYTSKLNQEKSNWQESEKDIDIWEVADKFPFTLEEINEQKEILKMWKKYIKDFEKCITKLENLKRRHNSLF